MVCSGKSTFINFVTGSDVQKTGVAPTDDAFTVIVPGHTDANQDGPSVRCVLVAGVAGSCALCGAPRSCSTANPAALCVQLVGDPDLGFNGLQRFGTVLINHLAMKVRKDLKVSKIMIVDSPGMIDSPVMSGGHDGECDQHCTALHCTALHCMCPVSSCATLVAAPRCRRPCRPEVSQRLRRRDVVAARPRLQLSVGRSVVRRARGCYSAVL